MDPSISIKMEPHLALGHGMGEETIKMLGDKGGEVVLVTQDTRKIKIPVLDAQTKAFIDALKDSKVTVKVTEYILEEEMIGGALPGGMQMPGQTFFRVIQKHPKVAAIVSFAGLPGVNDEQMAALGEHIPKCIAYDGFSLRLQPVIENIENHIVQVAIIPNQTGYDPAKAKNPETLREWFDRYYQVVTEKNVDKLLEEP